jgi:hypothetical protein
MVNWAMADPGVGKSRLFYEFKARSAAGWMVLETVSTSHGKASAYLPVIDLLRNYFRIANEDDERTRREKVAEEIVRALFEDGVLQRDSPHPDPPPDTLSWRDDTPLPQSKRARGARKGAIGMEREAKEGSNV